MQYATCSSCSDKILLRTNVPFHQKVSSGSFRQSIMFLSSSAQRQCMAKCSTYISVIISQKIAVLFSETAPAIGVTKQGKLK